LPDEHFGRDTASSTSPEFAVVAAFTTACSAAPSVTLTEDGKAKALIVHNGHTRVADSIHYDKVPKDVIKPPATEWQDYLECITGAKLPLAAAEKDAAGKPAIVLEIVGELDGASNRETAAQAYRIFSDVNDEEKGTGRVMVVEIKRPHDRAHPLDGERARRAMALRRREDLHPDRFKYEMTSPTPSRPTVSPMSDVPSPPGKPDGNARVVYEIVRTFLPGPPSNAVFPDRGYIFIAQGWRAIRSARLPWERGPRRGPSLKGMHNRTGQVQIPGGHGQGVVCLARVAGCPVIAQRAHSRSEP
jgi:hypothetical protein